MEGLHVVLHGPELHICLALAMLITTRVPDYDAIGRTSSAKWLYWALVLYHMIMSVIRWLCSFYSRLLKLSLMVFVMLQAIIVV